jgi:6-phosphogluconolactonase (cycloisomerase 2 family)
VTPSLAGYTFSQASTSYSNVLASQSGQNYTATAVGISITPGWTIPPAPSTTVGQSYTASVPAVNGDTYLWTITSGGATLINATTSVVTFTPTGAGTIGLRCVRTDPGTGAATANYSATATAGAILNAQPATISHGQGTILLATFSGTTGIINPGALTVTSNVGITVEPGSTTTYTLNVDGTDVATTTVSVLTFTPKYVYVSNTGDGTLSAFTIDLVTNPGALSAISGSPFATPDGNNTDQIAASPDGKFLFAAGQSGSVYAYAINSGTGALTSVSGSPFPAGSGNAIRTIAVDPFGRFLYAHGDNSLVYAYTINAGTGALTTVSGSPYGAGNNVDATNGAYGGVIVHPSGLFLYVAAAGDNNVHGFSINQTTGGLTQVSGSPFSVSGGGLTAPFAVAVDPTGAYFFTKGETGTSYLAGLSIDLATGALTTVPGSPFGPLVGDDAWHGLAFHPTLSVLYTTFYDSTTADAGAYALDLGTGNLTALSGSPYDLFPSSHGSDNIAIDRSGQFAYSTCYNGAVISNMAVHGTGTVGANLGALYTLGGVLVSDANESTTPVGTEPDSIAIAGALQ